MIDSGFRTGFVIGSMKILLQLSALLLILISMRSVEGYTFSALADQIQNLPGAEALSFDFSQFSGMLTLPNDARKNIHYWFVESTGAPADDPLTFWTNGGPGILDVEVMIIRSQSVPSPCVLCI